MTPRGGFDSLRLEAAMHAGQALLEFGQADTTRVDVFEAIHRAGAVLMFRPLDGLYGAYLPPAAGGASPGVIVHSGHPLSLQRFTAAHELGHLYMRHGFSWDDDIERPALRGRKREEVMAHAFAAHFLMPARAVRNELRLLGFADENLASPEVAYRLALSFGTSYRAMCFHLATLKLIDSDSASRIAGVAPITTKRRLLGTTSIPDSWADVWHVGPESGGRALHLRHGDHLLVDLPGRGADGYVWRPTDDTIKVTMVAPAAVAVRPGSPSPQRLHLIWEGQGDEVSFEHVRPWSPGTRLDEFSLTVATASKPPMGLSPLDRLRAA